MNRQSICCGSSTLSVQGFGFHHQSVHMFWFVLQRDKVVETLNIALLSHKMTVYFKKLHHYSRELSLILAIFFHEFYVKLVPCLFIILVVLVGKGQRENWDSK